MIRLIAKPDKNMANGMRNTSKTPLTNEEIEFVKKEIRKIGADESVFVFNDKNHIEFSTCYNFADDHIYVTKNVFPDDKYGSTHPRDLMSVAAVLAHEYYGHRPYREEYLCDQKIGNGYHTTPIWQDECRASINAAKITPNLSEMDKSYLILDAIYRAEEYHHLIEMDDFMKEVLYGYSKNEKNILRNISPINFVSKSSQTGNERTWSSDSQMPEMQRHTNYFDDLER